MINDGYLCTNKEEVLTIASDRRILIAGSHIGMTATYLSCLGHPFVPTWEPYRTFEMPPRSGFVTLP